MVLMGMTPYGGTDHFAGGEGKDSYILYKAEGLKMIENYPEVEIEDTMSLLHLNSTDVCVFLLDNDLYLQVDKHNLALAFYHGQYLTVMVINWKVGEKYRHLNFTTNCGKHSLYKFRMQQEHLVIESNNFTSNINVQFSQQLYSL